MIPRQEFFNHPLYRRPDITNPYVTWQMGQDATYVIHAFSSFLKELQEHVKTRLMEFQVTTHRGLVLPISVEQMKRLSNEMIVEKNGTHLIVLHPQNWIELDIEMRHSLLLDYAKEWDRWEGEPGDDSIASHLRTMQIGFQSRREVTVSRRRCLRSQETNKSFTNGFIRRHFSRP